MSTTYVLISGATRGIGKSLAQYYLEKPDHVVIAANRDLEKSQSLNNLKTGSGSRLIIVKVDASVEADAFEAVKTLSSEYKIDHLDFVIANAGVSYTYPKVSELKVADLQAHMEPNVYGAVWLYQATRPLLLQSSNAKYVVVGSTAGCLTDQLSITNAAYGPSKAAIHWLTKRIDAEEEKITSFVLNPGWVQTELGNAGAQAFGLKEALVTIVDSVTKSIELIEKATKRSHGGKLWDYTGEQLAW